METQLFEPLLHESSELSRLQLFPIRYHDIWNEYKKAEKSFWTAEDLVDFSIDVYDWKTKLTPEERNCIKGVLAFFACSDTIVNENINDNFAREVVFPEARCFYGFQIMMENIHTETYNKLIDTLVLDPKEKTKLFNAITTVPTVIKKRDWAFKFMNETICFAKRLLAFSIIEGVFFSSSFCTFFWLRDRNLLPLLTLSNEWIARDETLHRDFGCLLYTKYIVNKIPTSEIHEMLDEAVKLEQEFVCKELLPNKDIQGLNKEAMCIHVEAIADHFLSTIGEPLLYHKQTPFAFMKSLGGLQFKSNFFERRSSQYQKTTLPQTSDYEENIDY